jgi:hypothetical protein
MFIVCSKYHLFHVVGVASEAFCVIMEVDEQTIHPILIGSYDEKYEDAFHPGKLALLFHFCFYFLIISFFLSTNAELEVVSMRSHLSYVED